MDMMDEGPNDWASLDNNNRQSPRGGMGRGSYRGSRNSFKGSYRGRKGGGMSMAAKNMDEKGLYMIFEKPISRSTAQQILAFGKEANTVGFGRGCTVHFKTPEEAKEIMEKIKEMKFNGWEPNVEYAYKKRGADLEKRLTIPGVTERDDEMSPNKKFKTDDEKDFEEKEMKEAEIKEKVVEADEHEVEGEEAEADGEDRAENEEYEGADQEEYAGGDQEEEYEGGEQAEYEEEGGGGGRRSRGNYDGVAHAENEDADQDEYYEGGDQEEEYEGGEQAEEYEGEDSEGGAQYEEDYEGGDQE